MSRANHGALTGNGFHRDEPLHAAVPGSDWVALHPQLAGVFAVMLSERLRALPAAPKRVVTAAVAAMAAAGSAWDFRRRGSAEVPDEPAVAASQGKRAGGMPADRCLTTREAALVIGTTPRNVVDLAARGTLAGSWREGREWRHDPAEVLAYEARRGR